MAILGNLPAGPNVQAVPIAKVGELAENQWKVFDFPDQYAQGILINLPGNKLVAYSDVCTHLSCAVVYQGDGKLHCPCHDGLFDAATGNVTFSDTGTAARTATSCWIVSNPPAEIST